MDHQKRRSHQGHKRVKVNTGPVRSKKGRGSQAQTHRKKDLICLYNNVDTLTSTKMGEMEILVKDIQPDIVALTEVKPKNCRYELQSPEIQLQGYNCFNNLTRGGRGVALYVKENINATGVDDLNDHAFEDCVWCKIRLETQKVALIGCVYRSPNSDDGKNEDMTDLLGLASRTRKDHVLVMGDFNFPTIDWTNNSCPHREQHPASKFLEQIQDFFWAQHVTKPSHRRGDQTPHMLDLVFSSDEEDIEGIDHRPPPSGSHHDLLIVHTTLNSAPEEKKRSLTSSTIKEITKVWWRTWRT
jgi:endonuclease/exonuclease/phosphatase family metal-dependent hydrolase